MIPYHHHHQYVTKDRNDRFWKKNEFQHNTKHSSMPNVRYATIDATHYFCLPFPTWTCLVISRPIHRVRWKWSYVILLELPWASMWTTQLNERSLNMWEKREKRSFFNPFRYKIFFNPFALSCSFSTICSQSMHCCCWCCWLWVVLIFLDNIAFYIIQCNNTVFFSNTIFILLHFIQKMLLQGCWISLGDERMWM